MRGKEQDSAPMAHACLSGFSKRIHVSLPEGPLPQADTPIRLQIGHEPEVRTTHVHLIPQSQRQLEPALSVEGGLVLADEVRGLGHVGGSGSRPDNVPGNLQFDYQENPSTHVSPN